jgi:SAM-dependent methyltransferase
MRATRGSGFLETFLARQRMGMAERLIPESARRGRILDIGCGSHPLFLASTRFREKFGIDKIHLDQVLQPAGQDIIIKAHDIETKTPLPFDGAFFDAITMLAVFEHIHPEVLVPALQEVHRVLKRGGSYILTTPAAWSDGLLRLLARLGMVSREEIDEHKDTYDHRKILRLLRDAGFSAEGMQSGYFELGMNLWVRATK